MIQMVIEYENFDVKLLFSISWCDENIVGWAKVIQMVVEYENKILLPSSIHGLSSVDDADNFIFITLISNTAILHKLFENEFLFISTFACAIVHSCSKMNCVYSPICMHYTISE